MRMDVQPTKLHAQRRADGRFRRTNVVADIGAALGVMAIGVLVLLFGGQELSWLAGVVAGALGGAWIALRRGAGRTPLRLPRAPRVRAQLASDAPELRTASAISSLEHSGWRLLHEVPGLDTTYDHIAIGPGGLILLQS